jgi:tripartite-type tricarboxylate transporter receptor subunit TctC
MGQSHHAQLSAGLSQFLSHHTSTMNLKHFLSLALSLSIGTLSWAQPTSTDYPNKPIRIVAPSAAGGGFDLVARVLGSKLSEQMGQQFVVENRSGGGTLAGTQVIAKAPADGYHLIVGGLSNMALNAGLYKNPGYDPLTDFIPLRIVVSHSYTLVGRKDLPFNNMKDMLAYAKANPGKLNFGTSGPGTGQFILASLIKGLGNVDIQLVPYKGAQPVYMDLLGGRVDLFFDNTTTTRTYLESNQLKAFAVSSRQRAPDGPQIPTLLETGTLDLEMETWFGLFAPAKTPPAVVEKLRAEIDKVMQSADVRKKLQQGSGRIVQMNNAETESMLKSEATKWPRLLKNAGIAQE